ncbi:MAG TPA: hypothetical protein VHC47_01310, partial [Mucilaginibacter sp.]|nr:hypothetical protein [Mucilaginibacter sp.]
MMLGYQILAMVEVLNDYFSNGICDDLVITPSADTANMLKGQRLIFKTVGNVAVLLIQTDPTSGKPYIDLSPSTKFRFYVSINNPAFINYTNISYRPMNS